MVCPPPTRRSNSIWAPRSSRRDSAPEGKVVKYYNFDVQSTTPAPIYALFKPGASEPLAGQLNIVDVIPGDASYNDFWRVMKVNVPAAYVANSITSLTELLAAGCTIETTDMLVNCPVVPDGSTAALRADDEPADLQSGWYRGKVVKYFSFTERTLSAASDKVPVSPIYVAFNTNPAEPGGGPPSGFKTEPGSMQTHNVPATLPDQGGYSPLWSVNIYDNANFDQVSNLETAQTQTLLATGAANVNCPIVFVAP